MTIILMCFAVTGCGGRWSSDSTLSVSTPHHLSGKSINSNKINKQNIDVPNSYGVPSQVVWNNNTYVTKGWLKSVGKELGYTTNPKGIKVFAIKGFDPDISVALEMDYPNGKYVQAVLLNHNK